MDMSRDDQVTSPSSRNFDYFEQRLLERGPEPDILTELATEFEEKELLILHYKKKLEIARKAGVKEFGKRKRGAVTGDPEEEPEVKPAPPDLGTSDADESGEKDDRGQGLLLSKTGKETDAIPIPKDDGKRKSRKTRDADEDLKIDETESPRKKNKQGHGKKIRFAETETDVDPAGPSKSTTSSTAASHVPEDNNDDNDKATESAHRRVYTSHTHNQKLGQLIPNYNCACGYSSTDRDGLVNHLKFKLFEKTFACPRKRCFFTYNAQTFAAFKNHFSKIHKSPVLDYYVCFLCGELLDSHKEWHKHDENCSLNLKLNEAMTFPRFEKKKTGKQGVTSSVIVE